MANTHRPKGHRILESVPVDRPSSIPIEVPQPPTQPRVVMPYHLQIAHEDVVVGDVEPDEGRIQPDVRLRDVLPEQIRTMPRFAEVPFQPIQGLEQRIQIRFVRVLRRREAGLVDAVVDGVVDPLVHGVDLRPQLRGVEAAARQPVFAQVLGEQGVERGVEDADDLGALVVDDGLRPLVPQRRHRVPALVPRVRLLVQVLHPGEAVQRVLRVGAVPAGEEPSVFRELEVADDELDDGLEALEGADEVGAVRPGAAVVEVEGIPVLLRREPGTGRRGDEVPELGGFAAELAVRVGVLVDWGLERELAVVSLTQASMLSTSSGILRKMSRDSEKDVERQEIYSYPLGGRARGRQEGRQRPSS